MRLFLFIAFIVVGLPALLAGAWVVLNNTTPGSMGTPAHAGAVSNGRPEDCTTVQIAVRARSKTQALVNLQPDQILRGTYEADGGFGRVDIMMRIVSPGGGELYVSPRATNHEFQFVAKAGGDYAFIFDNRYSLVTAKAVALYYCVPGSGVGSAHPSQ